ncbi:class III extradiol dioxygenase subunit B-like domain-containing protein [Streptomyces sp. NPDC002643]
MLLSAAVCPCPPLLVPEVAAGAAPELDAARDACADALAALAATRPDRLVVVGPAEENGAYEEGARGSFTGFGVDLDVRLGRGDGTAGSGPGASPEPVPGPATVPGSATGAGPATGVGPATGAGPAPEAAPAGPTLPASLAVAAWLLDRADWSGAPVHGLGVAKDLAPERCIHIGRDLTGSAERVALLVMGDASACRTLKAPGYLDDRAAGFDARIAQALATADIAALKTLDTVLAHELKASGRAPWQILAGAAEHTSLTGTLLYDDAPYGVGYLVATWSQPS